MVGGYGLSFAGLGYRFINVGLLVVVLAVLAFVIVQFPRSKAPATAAVI